MLLAVSASLLAESSHEYYATTPPLATLHQDLLQHSQNLLQSEAVQKLQTLERAQLELLVAVYYKFSGQNHESCLAHASAAAAAMASGLLDESDINWSH